MIKELGWSNEKEKETIKYSTSAKDIDFDINLYREEFHEIWGKEVEKVLKEFPEAKDCFIESYQHKITFEEEKEYGFEIIKYLIKDYLNILTELVQKNYVNAVDPFNHFMPLKNSLLKLYKDIKSIESSKSILNRHKSIIEWLFEEQMLFNYMFETMLRVKMYITPGNFLSFNEKDFSKYKNNYKLAMIGVNDLSSLIYLCSRLEDSKPLEESVKEIETRLTAYLKNFPE